MKNIKLIMLWLLLFSGLIASPVNALTHKEIGEALKAVEHINPFNITETQFVDKGTYASATINIMGSDVTFIAYKQPESSAINFAFITKKISLSKLIPLASITGTFINKDMLGIELTDVTTILISPNSSIEKQDATLVDLLPQPIKDKINDVYPGVKTINLPTGLFSIYKLDTSKSGGLFTNTLSHIGLTLPTDVTSFISLDAGNYANPPSAKISLSVVLNKTNAIDTLINNTKLIKSTKNNRPVVTLSGTSTSLGIEYQGSYQALGNTSNTYHPKLKFTGDFKNKTVSAILTIPIDGVLDEPVLVPGLLKLNNVKMEKGVEISLGFEVSKAVVTVTPGFKTSHFEVNKTDVYEDVELKLKMANGAPIGVVAKLKNKSDISPLSLVNLAKVAWDIKSVDGKASIDKELDKELESKYKKIVKSLKEIPTISIAKGGVFSLVTPGMKLDNHFAKSIPLAGAGVAVQGKLKVFDTNVEKVNASLDIVNGLKIDNSVTLPELNLGELGRFNVAKANLKVIVNSTELPEFKLHGKLTYDGSLNPKKKPLVLSETEIKFSKSGFTFKYDMGCLPPFLKFDIKTKDFIPQLDSSPVSLSLKCATAGFAEAEKIAEDIGFISEILDKGHYNVKIDCYDASKTSQNNRNFKTKDKITVTLWNGNKVLGRVGKKPDCSASGDAKYYFKTTKDITNITIETAGKDAFWMDYVELLTHDKNNNRSYGQQGGAGFCLSKSSSDGKSFKGGNKCYEAWRFQVLNYGGGGGYPTKIGKVPTPIPMTVNAAANWGNNRGYFFGDMGRYTRANIETRKVDPDYYYPKTVSSKAWEGYPYWRVDAAVNWGNGKAYLFYNTTFPGMAVPAQYVRYDIKSGKTDPGYPKIVSSKYWKGLPFKSIDAAVNLGNGKAYFFSGKQYARYDIKAGKVDPKYPKTISEKYWKGLPFKTIDAAVNWGNGKVYFFSGKQYASYDIKSNKMDPGFPKTTSSYWNGLK
jgi:matrix metalloproteinase-14 (membrane-inserted)